MDGAANVDIVEEAADVKEYNRCYETGLDSGLSVMNQTQGSIDSAMVFAGPELSGGEDIIMVDVVKDAFGDNLLQKFAAAFKEGDRSVSFGEGVVRLCRFGNDYDKGVRPGVVTKGDGGVEKI